MYSRYDYTTRVIDNTTPLVFKPVEYKDTDMLRRFLCNAPTKSCDFTVGGIVIWKEFFKYEFCVLENTLFIKSLCEDGSGRESFLIPIGSLPIDRSIELLKEYCELNGIPFILTAVPEDMLDSITTFSPTHITELDNWGDYIYNAQSLATLSGKHYNKKRNHVNRFIIENPQYSVEAIDNQNIEDLRNFFSTLGIESKKADEEMADFEWQCCEDTLNHYKELGMEGVCLRDNNKNIVAFTLGEVLGDTLVIHIEKMEHLVPGAGETINKMYAERMTLLHPEIKYINREDDAGDPGLRFAKESYHPLYILKKFNIEF